MDNEQIINVQQENDEQEIVLGNEQQEQSVGVSSENIINLDYDDLENKPTALSDFTDDLGSSPIHTHSQYLTEHQSLAAYAKSADLADVATSGSYSDLSNKPTIPAVPTKLSSFTDDLGSSPAHTHSQYLTTHQDISGKQDALTAGDGISLNNSKISNTQSIEYIVGTQTAATNAWTGVSKDSTLKAGKIIAYYLPYAGTSAAATLQLTMADGTTTDAIELRRTVTSTVTTHFAAGNVIILIYDGTYWKVSAYYDANTNYVPTGYCTTGADTAAKSVTCNYGYRDDPTYFPCVFRYANTAANATLAISSYATTALPIYVNGARTTSSNTFGRGVIMFLYYNDAYYCYNDGRFPIVYNGAVTSIQDVLASLQS